MTTPITEIIDGDLPLETAQRAAQARGGILQTNGQRAIIAPRLLPGWVDITRGVERAGVADAA